MSSPSSSSASVGTGVIHRSYAQERGVGQIPSSTPACLPVTSSAELLLEHGVPVRIYRDFDGSIDEHLTFGRLID